MPGNHDKGQQVNNDVTGQIPPWQMNMRPTTIPAFGPGQQQMLANQLAMGGFGNPKANMAYLSQIYSPATVMSQGPLPKTPVAPPPKPTDRKPTTPTKWRYESHR